MLIRYTLFVISVILFLYGYFPINTNDLSNKVQLPSTIKDYKFNIKNIYESDYEKVVIVLIDALRHDFITKNNTPFIWKISNSDKGCLSKVYVETPTVTLPRIKSLINGNIPQYSDILLNLIRNEEISDSLIHSAVNKNKTAIFYGDDTWLKLLPKDIFKRSEGTSSFFVNDFTEVDNNVTRNVVIEMENRDWDVMVLHYLGLDHIGHLSGPFSPLIRPKLIEMDKITKNIYEKLQLIANKTILLVTGDHGMKDSGGHGGASYSEKHVPLVLLGYNCISTSIDQIDIAPTIATLLGIEIPRGNIGALAIDLLGNISHNKLLYKMHYNLLQLNSKRDTKLMNDAVTEYYSYLTRKHNNTQKLLELYKSSIQVISRELKNDVISQDLNTLVLSLLFTFNLLTLHLQSSATSRQAIDWFLLGSILLHINSTTSLSRHLFFCILILLSSRILYNLLLAISGWKYYKKLNTFTLVVTLTVIQPLTFFSSSFIEEEHQIWYYYGITIAFLAAFLNLKRRTLALEVLICLFMFRFVRRINQTGDKWSSLPDFKQFFKDADNIGYLIAYFVISLLLVQRVCFTYLKKSINQRVLVTAILIFTFLFRIFNDDVILGRITWCLIGFNYLTKSTFNNLIVTWLLIGVLLLRQYNIILLPFAVYVSNIIHKYCTQRHTSLLLHLWLGNMLYFCQGHSNSLSSIDIAVGYVGLNNYNPLLVMLQVLCHSYVFHILTYLLQKREITFTNYYFVLHRILSMFIIMLVVLLQRHHLFVWSVFAPKLLIETSHTIIYFIIMLLEKIR